MQYTIDTSYDPEKQAHAFKLGCFFRGEDDKSAAGSRL
jgi:hypothetical protein